MKVNICTIMYIKDEQGKYVVCVSILSRVRFEHLCSLIFSIVHNYIHMYVQLCTLNSRWIARVGVGFNFLKLPPARKARKNVGGGGEVKVHLPQALSLLSLQKQPKWQNRWIRRIFKQTGKQTKGVFCVTILVPFGNVCKYLPNYYPAILEKFISFACCKKWKGGPVKIFAVH